MSFQGTPCWYELGTGDPDKAGEFYAAIFGWQIADSGMDEFDYRLARSGADMVAGMMSNAGQQGNPPPNWLIYFAADDCDRTAADIAASGGQVLRQPDDIPGTGRYAIVADPQGAVFGLLQPDMSRMTEAERAYAEAGGGAFSHSKAGHCNWNELMSTDPEAGFSFYAALFGWTKGDAMDMGEMGNYQLFRHKGADIGAMMGLGDAPVPVWLPYFGVGQSVTAGIAVAQDPQGAWFAITGAER